MRDDKQGKGQESQQGSPRPCSRTKLRLHVHSNYVGAGRNKMKSTTMQPYAAYLINVRALQAIPSGGGMSQHGAINRPISTAEQGSIFVVDSRPAAD